MLTYFNYGGLARLGERLKIWSLDGE
jgi:hypothetical protein